MKNSYVTSTKNSRNPRRNWAIFCAFIFITCCLFALGKVLQVNAPGCFLDLKALDKIESADQKIDFLTDLISHEHSGVEKELVAYYLNLPPSEASSNPRSDSYKVGVFKIVEPLLIGDEKERFVKQVFDDEISNERELFEKDRHMVIYYPISLLKELMQVIEKEGRNWNLQDRLTDVSADKSLSRTTRSLAYTCNIKLGFAVDKGVTVNDIQNILDSIPLQPERAIPWEYYNDPKKRLAYDSGPASIAEGRRIVAWIEAGNRIKYYGQLEFLKAQGLNLKIKEHTEV